MSGILKEDVRTAENKGPVRLNKYLSDAGICSRREADRLIEAGRVTVDGSAAVTGQKIDPGQQVKIDGRNIAADNELILIAFNKPAGIECTSDRNNPDNIIDYIGYPERIFPIGRLDKNSTGLILLTNEGGLSDKILRSSNFHEKEYEVTVDRDLTAGFIKAMESGVEIILEDGKKKATTRKCRVYPENKRRFRIILTQGLNRQIRRMCKALGYNVVSLKRIRIMNINLGNLPEGHYRNVTGPEIKTLIKELYNRDKGDKNGQP